MLANMSAGPPLPPTRTVPRSLSILNVWVSPAKSAGFCPSAAPVMMLSTDPATSSLPKNPPAAWTVPTSVVQSPAPTPVVVVMSAKMDPVREMTEPIWPAEKIVPLMSPTTSSFSRVDCVGPLRVSVESSNTPPIVTAPSRPATWKVLRRKSPSTAVLLIAPTRTTLPIMSPVASIFFTVPGAWTSLNNRFRPVRLVSPSVELKLLPIMSAVSPRPRTLPISPPLALREELSMPGPPASTTPMTGRFSGGCLTVTYM